MAITPNPLKRTFDEYIGTQPDPITEEMILEFVFEALQHHQLGNLDLKAKLLSRARVLNPGHPLVTQFNRLQLDIPNNRIIIG